MVLCAGDLKHKFYLIEDSLMLRQSLQSQDWVERVAEILAMVFFVSPTSGLPNPLWNGPPLPLFNSPVGQGGHPAILLTHPIMPHQSVLLPTRASFSTMQQQFNAALVASESYATPAGELTFFLGSDLYVGRNWLTSYITLLHRLNLGIIQWALAEQFLRPTLAKKCVRMWIGILFLFKYCRCS